MKKVILFLVISAALTGCFKAGPDDPATQTVPITNNPHALPGPMNNNPLPNVF